MSNYKYAFVQMVRYVIKIVAFEKLFAKYFTIFEGVEFWKFLN